MTLSRFSSRKDLFSLSASLPTLVPTWSLYISAICNPHGVYPRMGTYKVLLMLDTRETKAR